MPPQLGEVLGAKRIDDCERKVQRLIEQVCDADIDSLASLLDKSLLRRRAGPDGADRYWMLETIREFAAVQLHEAGEESAAHGRHLDHYVAFAEAAELSSRQGVSSGTPRLRAKRMRSS